MAATAEKIEELEVPNGGIGDFVMEDDEAEAVYGKDEEDDEEEFGETGIAQFPDIAKKMATYGRNEDKFLAHVAAGELVIPFQFLENEDTKKAIFDMLIEAGLEDPERYVVGGEGNSINPTTGLPEFFFSWLKKTVKKVVSGVSKVLKPVVNIIKKVAPIVLPIVGTALFGPIWGAAMGSGISTLINGGDIGDAMKSALISGATGATFAGATGKGTFTQNVKAAGDTANLSRGFDAIKTGDVGKMMDAYNPSTKTQIQEVQVDPSDSLAEIGAISDPNMTPLTETTTQPQTPLDQIGMTSTTVVPENINLSGSVPNSTETSFLDLPFDEQVTRAGDYMFRGGETEADLITAGEKAKQAYKLQAATDGYAVTQQGFQNAYDSAQPNMLQRFGPSVLAGTALAAGAGAFKTPEQEEVGLVQRDAAGNVITGSDLIVDDPSRYLVGDLGSIRLNPETGQYEDVAPTAPNLGTSMYTAPTNYGAMPAMSPNNYLMGSAPSGPFSRPYVQAAAEGGPIFPRRNGGIAPTEGVEGQDSVRAMLMPGEFVMTTDAVRGLGNGNLNNGIQNMYSVMRNLESRGRKTA